MIISHSEAKSGLFIRAAGGAEREGSAFSPSSPFVWQRGSQRGFSTYHAIPGNSKKPPPSPPSRWRGKGEGRKALFCTAALPGILGQCAACCCRPAAFPVTLALCRTTDA